MKCCAARRSIVSQYCITPTIHRHSLSPKLCLNRKSLWFLRCLGCSGLKIGFVIPTQHKNKSTYIYMPLTLQIFSHQSLNMILVHNLKQLLSSSLLLSELQYFCSLEAELILLSPVSGQFNENGHP